jgi:hypothetical protein
MMYQSSARLCTWEARSSTRNEVVATDGDMRQVDEITLLPL